MDIEKFGKNPFKDNNQSYRKQRSQKRTDNILTG
ncbi:Uncharacterised protein [Chryseobacterium taklimakanense]|uniref:Uncharacterized protein n=1 Tax=Chryseobacterium taklimakanense TaxID=536441 RepID=A0A239X939_9FLAO|nr:Uncharacterised protein [Chryseobacterium taklimakanense]